LEVVRGRGERKKEKKGGRKNGGVANDEGKGDVESFVIKSTHIFAPT
jgi:hypothetical protein